MSARREKIRTKIMIKLCKSESEIEYASQRRKSEKKAFDLFIFYIYLFKIEVAVEDAKAFRPPCDWQPSQNSLWPSPVVGLE